MTAKKKVVAFITWDYENNHRHKLVRCMGLDKNNNGCNGDV